MILNTNKENADYDTLFFVFVSALTIIWLARIGSTLVKGENCVLPSRRGLDKYAMQSSIGTTAPDMPRYEKNASRFLVMS